MHERIGGEGEDREVREGQVQEMEERVVAWSGW